jgi:hypothetical protein
MQPSAHQLMLLALVSGGFALLGALVGTLISGFFSLRVKRNEYVNDYYKKVIDRRMAAYEQLESGLSSLRTTFLGADKKPYHLLFSREEASGLMPAYQMLHDIGSQALWLSDEANEKTKELNKLIWRFEGSGSTPVEFGQQHYQALATLRDSLERVLAADMLALHEVEEFLKKKKTRPDPGFAPWA